MESNHHCILRGDMSYPLNDDPKRGSKSKIYFRFTNECRRSTTSSRRPQTSAGGRRLPVDDPKRVPVVDDFQSTTPKTCYCRFYSILYTIPQVFSTYNKLTAQISLAPISSAPYLPSSLDFVSQILSLDSYCGNSTLTKFSHI